MSRVWLRMAGTSEATKYSLSPMPMTTGGRCARRRSSPIGARNHGQREDAGEFRHRRPHRFFQVAAEVLLDQVGDDLGVGLGANTWPSASS